MNGAGPTVTVVIPTRNRLPLLRETVASVREQTYEHWEAFVIDDGSNDGTAEWMAEVTREEPRLHYRHREGEPAGANRCRNQGVAASSGEYVIFLDSDDLLAPNCLEGRVAAMEAHPELDFGVFLTEVFYERPGDAGVYHSVPTPQCDLDRYLCLDIPWQTAGPIYRSRALEQIGDWREWLPCWQDWDYGIRALCSRLPYAWFPVIDSFWRHFAVQGNQRNTINTSGRTLSALDSKLRAVVAAKAVIEESGLLTANRRALLSGLALYLCQAAGELRSCRRSLSLWLATARKLELPRKLCTYAALFLVSRPFPLVRRLVSCSVFPPLEEALCLRQIPAEMFNVRVLATPMLAPLPLLADK